MPEEANVAALAELLAGAMSADLEEAVSAVDVLDWLASAGLTLRRDDGDGDATVGYQLLLGEAADDLEVDP